VENIITIGEANSTSCCYQRYPWHELLIDLINFYIVGFNILQTYIFRAEKFNNNICQIIAV